MQTVVIAAIPHHVGETVQVKGWVWHHRSSGRIAFIDLRDGTGIMQCVAKTGVTQWQDGLDFDQLTLESAVELTGTAKADARAPGGVEFTVETIRLLAISEDYPI
ncbi:MAG: OB-fold nucleic acid binding domain-containing protein, partial [Firmicutes bacterium]|nr:OB-fold nucleic acid binding domain-containing protein [Bacillota bacterium]